MKKSTVLLVRLFFIFLLAFNNNALAEDEAELAELMALLEQETNIATKSNMNADYVPGAVTVLQGDELRQLGFKTSGDALSLVPGVYISTGNAGEKVAIIRGLGASLKTSHLKIMLNGVSINSAVTGGADSVLRMPTAQIDRIEVIRGPGSSIYGEFAFSGVVNIITLKNSNVAQLTLGLNNTQQAFLSLSNEKNEQYFHWNLNAGYWETEGTGRESGVDNFDSFGLGHSSGPIFDHDKGQMITFDLAYADYEAKVQHIKTERGSYFGTFGRNEQDYTPNVEEVINLALSKQWSFSESLATLFTLDYQKTNLDSAIHLLIPQGISPPGRRKKPKTTEDSYEREGSSESYSKVNVQLNWQSALNNEILLIIEGVKFDVDTAYKYTFKSDRETIVTDKTSHEMLKSKRTYLSLAIQDQWRVFDNVEFTIAARYDDYSDIGHNISPRVASVWRIANSHIMKAQYSEAFRPPTLNQRYFSINDEVSTSSQSLKPENIATSEFSYTYKQVNRKIQTTIFSSRYSDLIERITLPGKLPEYKNSGELNAKGIEVEWTENIYDNWHVMSNISYVDTKDHSDIDENYTGTVNWLANVTLQWQTTPNINNSLLFKYVGEQEGAELAYLLEPHPDTFSNFNTIDYSLTYDNAFKVSNLTMRMVINNLTNEHWETQSYPTQWTNGLTQGERSWNVSAEYQF